MVCIQSKFINFRFEITNCKANQIIQLGRGKSRVFTSDDVTTLPDGVNSTNIWLQLGYKASYGACFATSPSYANGTLLTAAHIAAIANAEFCSANQTWYDGCENITGNIPTIKKRPVAEVLNRRSRGIPDNVWNYATDVDSHWPVNYVKDNMWDMTHYDYDDTPFDKAYKYHMGM